MVRKGDNFVYDDYAVQVVDVPETGSIVTMVFQAFGDIGFFRTYEVPLPLVKGFVPEE